MLGVEMVDPGFPVIKKSPNTGHVVIEAGVRLDVLVYVFTIAALALAACHSFAPYK